MARPSTKERLLTAAESLFASNGFAGTSLRELTQLADVNLAAVNYHFGSKDNLIREVLRRRLDDLYRMREAELDRLERDYRTSPPPLLEIVRAFVLPALSLGAEHARRGSPFVQVLARAFVEYQEELRVFMSSQYGEINRRFFKGIRTHLAHLPDAVAYARIDFFIGSLTYAMSDFGGAHRGEDRTRDAYWLALGERLVEFSVAGLTAEHADS